MDWFEPLIAPLTFLISPEKRIYWLYLLISLLLAIVVTGGTLFKRELWFNRSSLVDVCLLIVNQCLYKLIVVPVFALQISYAFSLSLQAKLYFAAGDWIMVPTWLATSLFTLTLFVLQDFAKFLVHYLFHQVPFLWQFHRVHHSATTLTPLTLYRIHPLEMLINATRSFLVSLIVSALFLFLFKNQIALVQVLGVNLFVFMFNLAASNLRHSPVYLGFGVLEKWFISPAQHQIHHSAKRAHYDKNFGSALALWDRLFGCWLASKNQQVSRFGFAKAQ